MKILIAIATLALLTSAGYAAAQNTDTQPADTQPAPSTAPAASAADAGSSATAGGYVGTDTDGRREHVKAPYGGDSQAQADAKEAPITDQLNQQALQAAAPQH